MKRIIYLSLCACLLTSCSLDLQPENGLTYSNSFNTEKELNATTTSIQYYINTTVGNNYDFATAGVLADNILDGKQLREWNPRTVITSEYSWKGFYDIIFESNLLLDNIDRTKDLSPERLNYHVGQAEFGLGLSYFLLAQRYGDAIITENSSVIKPYQQSSQEQVLAAAIEHAKKAYDVLPTWDKLTDLNGNAITNRQTASKGTATALLAQIYAWRGSVTELYHLKGNAQEDYQNAVKYATELIDNKVGSYQLCASPEVLCTYLSNEKSPNPEAIFSLYFDKTRSENVVSPNEIAQNYVSWPVRDDQTLADLTASTTYQLYKSTVETLFPDTTDKRLQAFFYQWGTQHDVDGTDYAIMYKFRKAIFDADQYSSSGKSYRTVDADYVYWRLADIYLLRAECNQKLGNEAQAIADLNVIRNRAGALSYPSTYDTEGLKKAIFLEREKEFIGENDARYADIIRNGYVKEELQGKFKVLTNQDIQNGALFLPLPKDAWQDKDGHVINNQLRQKPYWQAYN